MRMGVLSPFMEVITVIFRSAKINCNMAMFGVFAKTFLSIQQNTHTEQSRPFKYSLMMRKIDMFCMWCSLAWPAYSQHAHQ